MLNGLCRRPVQGGDGDVHWKLLRLRAQLKEWNWMVIGNHPAPVSRQILTVRWFRSLCKDQITPIQDLQASVAPDRKRDISAWTEWEVPRNCR
jgi:hypothetical protein